LRTASTALLVKTVTVLMKSLSGPGMSGKDDYLTLFQYVLDTLSRPVMSTKYERVFSSTKKLITPERNWPEEDITILLVVTSQCGNDP